jgi:uncharacterized protein (DUF58 family)
MDSQTLLLVVVLFALLVVVLMLFFRQRVKFKVQGPAGTSVEAEGSNEQPSRPPAVLVENARSHKGGLTAEDQTGRGATVRGVEVQQDINVRSGSGPKADPPA